MRLSNFFFRVPYFRKRQERRIISGEQPLKMFISSVMRDDLMKVRSELVDYINSIRGLVPWAFEFTPASSEQTDESYLRNVRNADFVIWLVGSVTTQPVENEINLAIKYRRKLLVFILPVEIDRDDKTKELLEKIKNITKYHVVEDIRNVNEDFELAIIDEFIRAIRNKPGLDRIAIMTEFQNSSRARCIARWQSIGINLITATQMFDDPNIGAPSEQLFSLMEKTNLVVLVGSFGSGKSLIAERILQLKIASYIKDTTKPIPIYMKAQNIDHDLRKKILNEIGDVGNPRSQGAFIVIDGADEAGIKASYDILFQSREIMNSWPSTQIFITSRPLPAFTDIEEKFDMPILTNSEIGKTIKITGNYDISSQQIENLPEPIKNAISKPFFAILWGKKQSGDEKSRIYSPGELIDSFITEIIRTPDDTFSNAYSLMKKIGVDMISSRGKYIHWRDICSFDELNILLKTRLVEKDNEKIGFPLPIIAQWFAANSLVDGDIEIDGILSCLNEIDHWRYPLSIIISLYSHEIVSRIITPIVLADPGFASQLIFENVNLNYERDESLPLSEKDCLEDLLKVYKSFKQGIGLLGDKLSPIKNDKSKYIMLGIENEELRVEYYEKQENDGVDFWWKYKTRYGTAKWQRSWMWKWCLDDFTDEISLVIDQKYFILPNSSMYKEYIWNTALDLCNLGDLYDKPLNINKILSVIDSKKSSTQYFLKYAHLEKYVNNLLGDNISILSPPWPTSDQINPKDNWIWSSFSDEQILERAIYVYHNAINDYQNIIQRFFNNISSRMYMATLLPIRMNGYITFGPSYFSERNPGIDFYFEPLSPSANNIVNLSLEDDEKELIDLHKLYNQIRKMRPNAVEWIFAQRSHSILQIFNSTPITSIVTKWLESDLKRIHWYR